MCRFVEPIFFQLGVDGLSQARFQKADGFESLRVEKLFQVRRQEILHDRVVGKIPQDFLAVGLADVFRDEHEMQLAAICTQRIPTDDQPARFQHERKEARDGMLLERVNHDLLRTNQNHQFTRSSP